MITELEKLWSFHHLEMEAPIKPTAVEIQQPQAYQISTLQQDLEARPVAKGIPNNVQPCWRHG